jgi:phage baseplate assembly protein W
VATLEQISSPVWTLSLDGGGSIVEGMDALRQCIDIIVRTTPGTDPLRPLFGCDVYKFQDTPLNTAIPRMKKAILDAIATWETRVNITSIDHTISTPGQILFSLTYTLEDKSLADSVAFLIGNGGVISGPTRQRLILRAFFPPNPGGLQYQISCSLDGEAILPAPPASGFASIQDLNEWVQANWLNYGQWYLNGDSLVGYMDSSFTKGSISISILAQRRVEGYIPALPIAYKYIVDVAVKGVHYTNAADLFAVDQVLGFVKNDPVLSSLGFWQVLTKDGSFNDDFMEDFDLYSQFLQLLVSSTDLIEININVVEQ